MAVQNWHKTLWNMNWANAKYSQFESFWLLRTHLCYSPKVGLETGKKVTHVYNTGTWKMALSNIGYHPELARWNKVCGLWWSRFRACQYGKRIIPGSSQPSASKSRSLPCIDVGMESILTEKYLSKIQTMLKNKDGFQWSINEMMPSRNRLGGTFKWEKSKSNKYAYIARKGGKIDSPRIEDTLQSPNKVEWETEMNQKLGS